MVREREEKQAKLFSVSTVLPTKHAFGGKNVCCE